MKSTALLSLIFAFSAHANSADQSNRDGWVSEMITMKQFKSEEIMRVDLEPVAACEFVRPQSKNMINVFVEIARRTHQPVQNLIDRMGTLPAQKVSDDFPKMVYVNDANLIVGSPLTETREIMRVLADHVPTGDMSLANAKQNPPIILRNEEGTISYAAGNLYKDRERSEILHVSCVNIGYARPSLFDPDCRANFSLKDSNLEVLKRNFAADQYRKTLKSDELMETRNPFNEFMFIKKKNIRPDSYACYIGNNLY